jgi:excisionase family DNA binding protein
MSIHSTGIGDDEPLGGSARPGGLDRRLTYTVPETARILGISRGAAYAAAADRTIPTIRVGRRLLVPRAALARLLRMDPASEETGA